MQQREAPHPQGSRRDVRGFKREAAAAAAANESELTHRAGDSPRKPVLTGAWSPPLQGRWTVKAGQYPLQTRAGQ